MSVPAQSNSGDDVVTPDSAKRLKSIVERVEKMLEDRKAVNDDIKDIYSEAKGVGFDTKTIRKLIQRRAMDAADRAEQDALLETYEGVFA